MPPRSHGSGKVDRDRLQRCGSGVVIEPGALIFHPENVSLADDVYVGHYAILKGYYKNELVVGEGTWIGQGAFLHAAGGITIGRRVGIAPHVCVLTSVHANVPRPLPIMDGALELAPVTIGDGSDIGIGAIILPGVSIGAGVQVGAGAVVLQDLPDFAVAVGSPARVVRIRS